ncbi:hypothetical protein PIB30_063975 [Stylosanthes scabra]|uniref:Uncharacterized protein n=1 Tax=Stylosanthes scabra TaxID=79078 RepID=A0ABU6QL39_9FABA|nr:hypothetical protein [Stylosanthes scabra]
MSSTGRGDDVWWPERLATWYEGWRGRGSPQVLVTVHEGDLRGTQRYYDWFAAAARHGRFLSRAADLADPRWNMAPPGIPADAVYPRDELVMPEDAPAPRRRGDHQPRPRQAAPARGKLSRRDQRRRARMVVVDDEDRAEEQQQYDSRSSDDGRGPPDHHSRSSTAITDRQASERDQTSHLWYRRSHSSSQRPSLVLDQLIASVFSN